MESEITAEIDAKAHSLLDAIEALCPDPRDKSLARARIEDGVRIAKRALTRSPSETNLDPPTLEEMKKFAGGE